MRRLPSVVAQVLFFLMLAACTQSAWADIIKKGKSFIPGHPGKEVNWRAAHSKTPYGNPVGKKDVHFWLDLELDNPQAGDDVTFVVCTMLNVTRTKIPGIPAFVASIANGTWTCSPDPRSPRFWYPNYHFGCERVRLFAGNSWKRNVIDETVDFSVEFDESEIAAPYIDLALDCPNGFVGCDALFGARDQFLTPGDGNFPNDPDGTSSYWIYNGGSFDVDPLARAVTEGVFHLGNWYTMAQPEQDFPSLLEGTLTNAPIGSLVEIQLPESTGACGLPVKGAGTVPCVQSFEVTDDPFPIAVPLTITEELEFEDDEHAYFRLSFPVDQSPPNPDEVIEFLGQMTAQGSTTLPDGSSLFEPGDFMHGVHLQFAYEQDLPFVAEQQLVSTGVSSYELSVSAADLTTMAIGASVQPFIDGVAGVEQPMPFDDPAEVDGQTRFRTTIGPLAPLEQITRYDVRLIDDAGNISTTTFTAGFPDCNRNGIEDDIDIATGTSPDVDANGIPDECQSGSITWVLTGTAEGGSVSITVEGFFDTCTVIVPTVAGQTAAEVVALLAAAINADPCLVDQEITASADGTNLTIRGFHVGSKTVSESIDDPGLGHVIPVLSIPTMSPRGPLTLRDRTRISWSVGRPAKVLASRIVIAGSRSWRRPRTAVREACTALAKDAQPGSLSRSKTMNLDDSE